MTRCCLPYGNQMRGLLRAAKIAMDGVWTAAARCMGPLSWPRKARAWEMTAALSRGERRPQRLMTGLEEFSRQPAAANSLDSFSSAAPHRAMAKFGYRAAR